jgi:predicted phosphodiesterase
MKYAVLGDIHSNLEALQAVISDAKKENVDRFVCVGDIVGYNSNPKECIDIIRAECDVIVKGNHDHYCSCDSALDNFNPLAAEAITWTRQHLSDDDKSYLGSLKYVESFKDFMLVHSSLNRPERWTYVYDHFEAMASFLFQPCKLCFYGHTHVPLCFVLANGVQSGFYTRIAIHSERKYFVNVGSVGQPRDKDPRSAYVIYNSKDLTIDLRRVEYNYQLTQEKILNAGLPVQLATRLEWGL